MSRTENIKRAKLLRQRKIEKEKLSQQTDKMVFDKRKPEPLTRKKEPVFIDRSLFGRTEKISALVLEMIMPLYREARDLEDVKGIVSFGITAWNGGVIKATKGDAELQKMMRGFKGFKDINLELFEEYIKIKCTKYRKYNDFISGFDISFPEKGKLKLTVRTKFT